MWRSSAVVSSLKRSIGAAAVVSGGPFVLLLVVALERDDDESTTITHLEAAPRFQPKILVHRPSVVHTTTPSPSNGQILSRQEQIEALKTKHFDVLVVGAGATGGGAALDATTRGLSTALIERGDFGNETSSRSTKLIWAGIRYIATAVSSLLRFKNIAHPIQALSDFFSEFSMVQSAHHERRLLIDNNPHLTKWVPIAVPIKEWISWPAPFGHPVFASAPLTLPAVFKFYDSMSGFTCPPSHIMRVSRAQRKFPQLDETVKYFQVFYEATHNDARTATYIALTAAEEGATVANYVEMIALIQDPTTGKATGVTCRDNLTGRTFDVKAKAVIFAGGPFTDQLRKMEDPDSKPAVSAAAGTHIVLPGYYCPAGIGMLDINTSDGRFLFFLPWEGHTIVGTTDRKGPAVSTPQPPEDEINWILREVEKYLSKDLRVRRTDVLSAWQGFRPLASDPHAEPGAPVSRDHIISTNPVTGVTFITGGKWTTYRHMAEDVIDRIVQLHQFKAGPCVTDKKRLRGGDGYTRNVPVQLVQEFGVSEEVAKHLARTYGMHAFEVCRLTKPTGKTWPRFGDTLLEGFPYLECEIEYACKHEMVVTLKDMLTLRMRLAFLNKEATLAVAPKVADLMAQSLGWSRRERNRQLKEAEDYVSQFGGSIPANGALAVGTISDVRDLFHTFDMTGNGYIDLVDLKHAATMLGFPFANDSEARRAFERINTHHDGKITEDEFVAWWNSTTRDKLKRNIGERFIKTRVTQKPV